MKSWIFLFLLALFMLACKDNEFENRSDVIEPNAYKYYLPYQIGDHILFADSLANMDTIIIQDIKTSTAIYSSKDNFKEGESWAAEFNLNYNSGKTNTFLYSSLLTRFPPYLIVSNNLCSKQVHFFSDNSTIGRITKESNIEFKQVIYKDVIRITFNEPFCPFNEILLAKDTGFVYIKIDDKVRMKI